MNTKPKISIVTVSYNSDKYIDQTITSVAAQTYENIEYIIIDGGSNDGTIDIIKKNEAHIDRWMSEPDDGIAHAMNKGIDLATGDYILFLHSDDYLLNPKAIEEASLLFKNKLDIYIFPVILKDNDTFKRSLARPLNFWTNFKMGSCHQGQFCSKKLFEKLGVFDTDFKITMDYDFLLRAYRADASSLSINIPISVMRLTGISSQRDWPSLQKRFHEERAVQLKNCSGFWMLIIYRIYWALYLPYRKILCGLHS